MPLFAFYCRDGEHSAVFREHTEEALHEHFAKHGDDFAVAGPLAKDDKIVGSLLIIKADDEAGAREKLEAIPYFSVGVWQSIRADEFRPLFGEWGQVSGE
ncbi:MAG: YciI family protein [Erythrobacter sp.]